VSTQKTTAYITNAVELSTLMGLQEAAARKIICLSGCVSSFAKGVKLGHKLEVWSTRITGLHTYGDPVRLAYLREGSLCKYKYNEDETHNRETDREGQTWHGKRMNK
jgi:hypothetical protein